MQSPEVEQSFIGRWIGWVITPLATALATLIAVKAKAWFGVDVDPAEALAFILSVASGFGLWLYNRGKYEVAKVSGVDPEVVDAVVQKVIEEKFPTTLPPAGEGPIQPRAPGGLSSGQ